MTVGGNTSDHLPGSRGLDPTTFLGQFRVFVVIIFWLPHLRYYQTGPLFLLCMCVHVCVYKSEGPLFGEDLDIASPLRTQGARASAAPILFGTHQWEITVGLHTFERWKRWPPRQAGFQSNWRSLLCPSSFSILSPIADVQPWAQLLFF